MKCRYCGHEVKMSGMMLISSFGQMCKTSPTEKHVIIPDGIEYIGSGAFKNCTNLTNVTLPTKRIEYKGTEDGSTFNTFYNCPRISLKDRKKIKETGYTGTFTFD